MDAQLVIRQKFNAWPMIHSRLARYVKTGEVWNPTEQKQWYETNFVPLIPRDGCGCEDHWAPIAEKLDWSTAESAELSFYEAHNEVSTKYAGHAAMSVEQAKKLWRGPRVAFIHGNYGTHGGTEAWAGTLLPRLRHRRNIVGFGCIVGGGDPAVLKVPYFEGRAQVAELCKQADIIVTWGTDELTELIPTPRPKVIAIHHGDLNSGWFAETMAQPEVDEFVCVNKQVADHIREVRKLPVHWIPNAIDEARIQPTAKLESVKSMISEGTKVVLFGHRFSPEKRPELAVEMAKHLPPDWLLVMAGDGPRMNQCRNAANGLLSVHFAGRVETLADWLAVTDCFISMAIFEGFGLSMAEALACGVPLVATPVGIAPSFANTLLSAEANAEEWANAVVEVQRNDRTAGFVRKVFSVEGHVEDWARVLAL